MRVQHSTDSCGCDLEWSLELPSTQQGSGHCAALVVRLHPLQTQQGRGKAASELAAGCCPTAVPGRQAEQPREGGLASAGLELCLWERQTPAGCSSAAASSLTLVPSARLTHSAYTQCLAHRPAGSSWRSHRKQRRGLNKCMRVGKTAVKTAVFVPELTAGKHTSSTVCWICRL